MRIRRRLKKSQSSHVQKLKKTQLCEKPRHPKAKTASSFLAPLRLTALLAVGFMLPFVTSCPQEQQRITILPYLASDPFIAELTTQLATDLAGDFEVTLEDSQNSQIIQNEFIEEAIQRGDGLLIINPVDRLGVYPIIKRLKAEGIPVIFYNREPLAQDMELWSGAYYVGAWADQSGKLQAQMVAELFNPPPEALGQYDINGDNTIQMLIFKGEQGHQDSEIRTNTLTQTLRQMGYALDIISTEVANWDYNTAYEKMEKLLLHLEEPIELIASNNDAMALGAIAKLRQSGYFKDSNGNGVVDKDDETWVPVIGIDGIEEAVSLIESGHLYGTVRNDSEKQATIIAELGRSLLAQGGGSYGNSAQGDNAKGDGAQGNNAQRGKPINLPYSFEKNQYHWVDYKIFTLE